MFRKFAAAVIAVSLIAGPVLAQGTPQGTSTAPVTTGQPAVKANGGAKHTVLKVTKTKKHVAKNFHHRKHVKHVKHVKNVKHFAKHGKTVKHLKTVKQPAKVKISG